MNGDNAPSEKRYLDAIDYTIFIGMIVTSVVIGLYFAYLNKKKPNTTSEYLTGNKELSVFPIAMSLSSSYISAMNFLAQPAEVYMYGSQLLWMAIFSSVSIVLMMYTVLPVFCSLDILSSYQYLTKRFDYKIGVLGSVLFLIKSLLYTSAVIYTPAITLSQLSGLKLEILIPILSIVCIFYTSIGGLRAVVWADTIQTLFMLIGAVALTILGTYHAGGFKNVWERNEDSGRIEFFNFDPDPRIRLTFWTVSIGYFVNTISDKTVNQMIVQRCLSLSTFKKVKITLWIFATFVFTIIAVNGYNGLVAFAIFHDCDPITTKAISKADQIIPYLWMFLTKEIPALPGIFVSAIFAASFSTISTNLNSMAGVFVIDIVKPLCKKPITEAKATCIMKTMVIIFGCMNIIIAFIIDKLGGLFQMVVSITGITNGPLFGIFLLGMFFPRANVKGVLVGALAGFSLVTWIFVGAQINPNRMANQKKPFSIEGCDNSTLEQYYGALNQTKDNFTSNRTEPFPLYAISFYYYGLIATLTTVVVGLIVSYFTGGNGQRRINANLFSPIVRKFIKTKCEEAEEEQLNITD